MKGNDDNTVYPAKWPKKSGSSNNKKQNNSCTLKELLQSNNIDSNYNDSDAILCFETPVTYCCRDVKVDSKDYGGTYYFTIQFLSVVKQQNSSCSKSYVQ